MPHTPGPWRARGRCVWSAETNHCIASALCEHPTELAEAKSNALLIASAPDLLAALREARMVALAFRSSLRDSERPLAGLPDIIDRIDAAIAKAEGR